MEKQHAMTCQEALRYMYAKLGQCYCQCLFLLYSVRGQQFPVLSHLVVIGSPEDCCAVVHRLHNTFQPLRESAPTPRLSCGLRNFGVLSRLLAACCVLLFNRPTPSVSTRLPHLACVFLRIWSSRCLVDTCWYNSRVHDDTWWLTLKQTSYCSEILSTWTFRRLSMWCEMLGSRLEDKISSIRVIKND